MSIRIIALIVVAAAIAACSGSWTRPTATEEDFGNSAASLVKAQAANPEVVANPSTEPVTSVDPDYAGNVVEAMRESVSKPSETQEPIAIRVGGQSK